MKFFLLLFISLTILANEIVINTVGQYKRKKLDTEVKARYKALQIAKSNAIEEAGTIIQSKFSSYSDSDGTNFSEYDLEMISSSLIKTKILNEYQKDGYYFVEIKASVDTSHIEKYREDFTAIKRKVKNNKNANSKSNKLAKEISNKMQVMLNQNNGKVKVINSTYMTRVLSYRNSVNVYYTIEQEELIKSVMQQRDISYNEAYQSANSEEFIDNVKIVYPINFRNHYCNTKSIRKVLKDGVEIYSNISWSNGTPILNLSKVSEKICVEHKQNEQVNNKLFQDTVVKYEKPKVGFEKDIELIQSKLPMRIDKITTLISMIALEKKIIYRYSLNEIEGLTFKQLQDNKEQFKTNAIKMITSGLCNKEETKNILKDGGVFEYIYMLENLEYYTDFQISWKDCK